MLVAYLDDSDMGQAPVSVLAGWLHESEKWELFSNEWTESLGMQPKLDYFKYTEARSLTGQFFGWHEETRNERVRRLMRIISDFQPFGIASAMPYDLYQRVFGQNEDSIIRFPYFFSLMGVVVGVAQYLGRIGRVEQVDFVFDIQPGQMDAILGSWSRLLESCPPDLRPILPDYPIFRNDKTTRPLQAADLCAGYQREQAAAALLDQEPPPPIWGNMGESLHCVGRFWTEDMLIDMMQNLNVKRAASGGQFGRACQSCD